MHITMSHSMTTKTFLFSQEFINATTFRKGSGRLFRRCVIINIKVANVDRIIILRIETPKLLRSKGNASACLKWLCEMADDYKVTLALGAWPTDDCGFDLPHLISWYKKHGFIPEGTDNEMIRLPKCSLTT